MACKSPAIIPPFATACHLPPLLSLCFLQLYLSLSCLSLQSFFFLMSHSWTLRQILTAEPTAGSEVAPGHSLHPFIPFSEERKEKTLSACLDMAFLCMRGSWAKVEASTPPVPRITCQCEAPSLGVAIAAAAGLNTWLRYEKQQRLDCSVGSGKTQRFRFIAWETDDWNLVDPAGRRKESRVFTKLSEEKCRQRRPCT